MGIQLRATSFSGASRHAFIDESLLEDVIINEGISMCSVVFYLAFIVRGHQRLVLGFSSILPRYSELSAVHRGIRNLLYDEEE